MRELLKSFQKDCESFQLQQNLGTTGKLDELLFDEEGIVDKIMSLIRSKQQQDFQIDRLEKLQAEVFIKTVFLVLNRFVLAVDYILSLFSCMWVCCIMQKSYLQSFWFIHSFVLSFIHSAIHLFIHSFLLFPINPCIH